MLERDARARLKRAFPTQDFFHRFHTHTTLGRDWKHERERDGERENSKRYESQALDAGVSAEEGAPLRLDLRPAGAQPGPCDHSIVYTISREVSRVSSLCESRDRALSEEKSPPLTLCVALRSRTLFEPRETLFKTPLFVESPASLQELEAARLGSRQQVREAAHAGEDQSGRLSL